MHYFRSLHLPPDDAAYFALLATGDCDGGEDSDGMDAASTAPKKAQDQTKKTLDQFPKFPVIPRPTGDKLDSEANRVTDFVLHVDEFAALNAGSLNHATLGRFAMERLYTFNASIVTELGEGVSIATPPWTDLRNRLLRHYWSPVLAVQGLHRFLAYCQPANTTFINYVRVLTVKYCHFRALLPTDAMFPHLSPLTLAIWALARIHPAYVDRYQRVYNEQGEDIIATFKIMLRNETIPREDSRPVATSSDSATSPEAPKEGRLRAPPTPVGWTRRSAAIVAEALAGKCRRCALSGHAAKDCTAAVSCDHASSVDCGAYTTVKPHTTAGCPLTPPTGWTKP
jgi:hypothetical protein